MNFIAKKLHASEDSVRIYHLFDDKERLVLVAEFGSPWSSDSKLGEVRFSKPDGDTLAKLTSLLVEPSEANGRFHTDYALIVDFAVHAIFNQYRGSDTKDNYFILEVGESEWLGLETDGHLLSFYDQVPADFRTKGLDSLALPEGVGHIDSLDEQAFEIELPAGRLNHLSLIALAWVVVLDR